MGIYTFGGRRIHQPEGHPHILQASPTPAAVLITSNLAGCVRIPRHWDQASHSTQICQCSPHCATHRIDTVAACVMRLDTSDDWEERLLLLTESAMRELTLQLARRLGNEEIAGTLIRLLRVGDKNNGRVAVQVIQQFPVFPPPFDLHKPVFQKLGVDPSKLPNVDPDASQEATLQDKVNGNHIQASGLFGAMPLDAARDIARDLKPRIAKGRKQG